MIDPACNSPIFGRGHGNAFFDNIARRYGSFPRAKRLSTAPREVLSALDTVRISPVL
jgi:hypothetical protein